MAGWPVIGTIARLGRSVFVTRQRGSTGRERDQMRGMLAGGQLALVAEFDCNAPLLPAFRRAPGFTF